jgi:hypothetical protein
MATLIVGSLTKAHISNLNKRSRDISIALVNSRTMQSMNFHPYELALVKNDNEKVYFKMMEFKSINENSLS